MSERKPIILLEEGWSFMKKAFAKLLRILDGSPEQFSSEESMNLYTIIYNMCTQKPPNEYSSQLYEKYKGDIASYINSTVIPSLREKSDEFLLRENARRWRDHKIMVKWLTRFFYYLDRYFLKRSALPSLRDTGLHFFRDLVYGEFKGKARDAVIDLISREREENMVDRSLLKEIVDMYIEMGMRGMDCYENDFENVVLDDAAEYYSRKASQWIVEDSFPEYMIKVEDCLKKEKARVSHYLHSSTETRLLEQVLDQLLTKHLNELLRKENSGCRALLRDEKMEDLSRMYRLFQKIPIGLQPLADTLKEFVSDEGMALIKQADDAMSNNKAEKAGGAQALELVTKIIELRDRIMVYVNDCFSRATLFDKALKEAFESFCNKVVGGCTIAEMLASYCDDVLKKGASEKLSTEATEGSLDKAVCLLAYISDKDLFAEFYRKKLSRRLLFERSFQDDLEKFLLSKLKQQCGGHFTSKMEGMVQDMALAKERQSQLQKYLSDYDANLGLDLSVTVITTGCWPSYKNSDLNLPAEMANCVQVFKDFYTANSKKKLTWIYSLGHCNIEGNFQKKPIELAVTTFQAALLLLFNHAERLSYAEIKMHLNLEDDDVIRVLHSLSCAKYKILNKEPNTKSISPDDYFEFNSNFTDKMRRIKISLPPANERKKVIEDVEKDRRYVIDATLVRIMKSRKVLAYQQLITECVKQLSKTFKPEVKDIKKRIEELIARDYLERDKESPNMFKYLA